MKIGHYSRITESHYQDVVYTILGEFHSNVKALAGEAVADELNEHIYRMLSCLSGTWCTLRLLLVQSISGKATVYSSLLEVFQQATAFRIDVVQGYGRSNRCRSISHDELRHVITLLGEDAFGFYLDDAYFEDTLLVLQIGIRIYTSRYDYEEAMKSNHLIRGFISRHMDAAQNKSESVVSELIEKQEGGYEY